MQRTMPSGFQHAPRIAVVASSLRLAGAEKQTVYMTRALFEAGMDARFLHLGQGGYYEGVLRRMGISFQRVFTPNRPGWILFQLIKNFFRFRPQIVFVPQFGDLLQGGVAGRLCNALVLGGLRSDGFYELNAHPRASRWMLRVAHGLVANSHCGRQNLVSRGGNPAMIKVLPNALDLDEFDSRSSLAVPLSIPPDRLVAVAVGSLQPGKRFDRFLKALALARRKAPALLGIVAGPDCGCRRALEQEAAELGLLPGHVVFYGECDNVPALLARSGLLVLCSEFEGFPNVILEAMAARLPVITTSVGDAARIVIQDQTGFLVEGDNIQAIAGHLAGLALSPETRLRLGAEGRRRVAWEYNYESMPMRLLSIFRDFAVQARKHRLVEELQGWFPLGQSIAPLPGELFLPGDAAQLHPASAGHR